MIIEKYYTVADTAVCIAADEKIMYGDDGVLAPFARASVSGGVVRYEYEISDSLPDPCGTPTRRIMPSPCNYTIRQPSMPI